MLPENRELELLTDKQFYKLAGKSLEFFPFCFSKDFLSRKKGALVLHSDGSFATVIFSKYRFLEVAQFQTYPVSVSAERLAKKEEAAFCSAAVELISKKKLAHRIVQPVNHALFMSYPAGSVHAPFGTYVVMLHDRSDEEILASMQARYRSAIRQVQKLNFEIRQGLSELKAFHALHADTMKRTGAHIESYDKLESDLKNMPGNTLLANVYIDGILQGGVFLAYSKFAAYYFHGASAKTTSSSGAIKFLHFKMMCIMRDKGVREYDFVGARVTDVLDTKLAGIQNFKKYFGGTFRSGHLWKADLHKTKCAAYDRLLKISCNLKNTKYPVDIIDQERKKKLPV